MSSPNVEKHLVISIGEHFYLALAKGSIDKTHLLILPVTHIQSVSLLSADDWKELDVLKNAVVKYFKSIRYINIFIMFLKIINVLNCLCFV